MRRYSRASLPIPCGLNSDRHSITCPWWGEGFYVEELVVAALVTGADRSHTAVGEPLLVMNKLSMFTAGSWVVRWAALCDR